MTLRLLVSLAVASGCSTASITLTPASPVDLTVPKAIGKHFEAMMVLPPRGSEHGQVSELSDVERVLLSGGVRVISSGVTGRVVLDASGNRVETAANLSDLERALVLAKTSNADALLQVVEIGWSEGHRAFEQSGDSFQEIAVGTPVANTKLVRLHEALFRFQARLINVENGEIMMSIDVSQGTSRVIPEPKTITIESSPISSTTAQDIDTDTPERRREVVTQVMGSSLTRITQSGQGTSR